MKTQNNLTLANIATIKQGFNIYRYCSTKNFEFKPDKYTVEQDYWNPTDSDYKYFVRMQNVFNGIVLHDIFPVFLNQKSLERSKLLKGDILLTIRGRTIKAAMVEDNEPRNLYATNDISIIRPKADIPSVCIWALFFQPNVKDYIIKRSGRTLKMQELKDIPIKNNIYDKNWLNSVLPKYKQIFNTISKSQKGIERSQKELSAEILQLANY